MKLKLAKKINEICPCGDRHCLLKEIIVCSHNDPKWITQLKCMEIYKFVESEIAEGDIGKEEAHMGWVIDGYAKKYSQLYNEDLSADEQFRVIRDAIEKERLEKHLPKQKKCPTKHASDMADKSRLVRKLNQVCPCGERQCILKDIILCSHNDPEWLVRLKCLELHKYFESEIEKHDIGGDEAHNRWVVQGYAKMFIEVYDEEKTPEQVYKLLRERVEKSK